MYKVIGKTALNCLRLFVVVYKLVISELSPWYISVPSFIVRGPTISKLKAQTSFTSIYCLRLFVVVYKLHFDTNDGLHVCTKFYHSGY